MHWGTALSNSELFAILIGSGTPDESAVGLMQRILSSVDNDLNKFQRLSLERLMKFKDIGEAKAIKLKAAIELNKRVQQSSYKKDIILITSKKVNDIISADLSGLPHEEFWVLYLNQSLRLIEKYRLSKGGISQIVVDIRLAFKRTFEVGATALIPSSSDKEITRKFKTAATQVDLRILDHIIVSEKAYFSFADEDLL
jgi:DNA repair protein RadC